MTLGKKNSENLKKIINGLLVYQSMTDKAITEGRIDDARNAMRWFDERAGELEVKYGIAINKYKV
jgi:hypothetical protein